MDDYTLSMADAITEHQGNADADNSVNESMADAITEYQGRFSADTERVTEHQATIPADTNHSPGAKIVFASADAIATPSLPEQPPMQTFVPLCPMSHRWDKWDKTHAEAWHLKDAKRHADGVL